MNILMVNKFYWPKGGSEIAFFALSRLLEQHGNTVVPFSMKHSMNLPSPYSEYFVDEVDYDHEGLWSRIDAAAKIVHSLEARRKIKRLLDGFEPDICNFHIFQHQISPSVFGPLRQRQIPIILTLHDLKPLCPAYRMLAHDGVCERCKGRQFYNCLLHRCVKSSRLGSLVNTAEMYIHYAVGYYQNVDHYIAVSRFYRDKMIEHGFPEEQITYIPNSIDVDQYTPGFDRGYGLYFGRLSEEKGVGTLIEALAKCPEVPFKIVGSGPLEKPLMAKAREAGLAHVEFLGQRAGNDLKSLVQEASFAVLPSEWYENCPMSVLEAFACGKPVIASRIGGLPELVADGVDGFTFTAGDADGLRQAILKLWGSASLRLKLGGAGRSKVQKDFSPEAQYQRTIDLYRRVVRR